MNVSTATLTLNNIQYGYGNFSTTNKSESEKIVSARTQSDIDSITSSDGDILELSENAISQFLTFVAVNAEALAMPSSDVVRPDGFRQDLYDKLDFWDKDTYLSRLQNLQDANDLLKYAQSQLEQQQILLDEHIKALDDHLIVLANEEKNIADNETALLDLEKLMDETEEAFSNEEDRLQTIADALELKLEGQVEKLENNLERLVSRFELWTERREARLERRQERFDNRMENREMKEALRREKMDNRINAMTDPVKQAAAREKEELRRANFETKTTSMHEKFDRKTEKINEVTIRANENQYFKEKVLEFNIEAKSNDIERQVEAVKTSKTLDNLGVKLEQLQESHSAMELAIEKMNDDFEKLSEWTEVFEQRIEVQRSLMEADNNSLEPFITSVTNQEASLVLWLNGRIPGWQDM